ncbi:protein of unknown function [Salinibacillus kushneri]|uniref:Lin1244/Lin1753-like N-terminal domain-containing protein n=1 Tax=Salinibacillus kushneri TaxID=237682 RepID=A0A1I0IEM2_9BACI|nr:DUF4373 domain-containing protein [Salinibacillus kushneri]SET95344.1 protein of unknown function [Salinibacillus kushneri]
MVRPIKEGLDYFPLDVDIDQDDKIVLIEATHGLEGFGVVIKLLMKIYDNSYFYQWGEKEQLLFSRKVNVDINKVNVILNDCLKWGLFSTDLYEKYEVLTSKGIQRRYLEASSRRKKVFIHEKYLLLSQSEVNVYKNLVIERINQDSPQVNDSKSTQRKVKQSKGKESKAVKNENTTAIVVIDKYLQLKGQMHPSPKDQQAAELIEKEGVPPEQAESALVQCFEDFEANKRHQNEKINSLKYCVGYILDRYYEDKDGENNDNRLHGRRNSYAKGHSKGKSYEQVLREAELGKQAATGR